MGTCTCGYTRDYEEYCDGTHKVVREVRNKIVEELKNQEWHEAAEFVRNMK